MPLSRSTTFTGIRRQSRGPQHGQVEHGDVLAGAALLRPGVFGVLGFLDLELLHLRRGLFAGIVGIVQRLHRLVQLLRLVDIAVAGSDQACHGAS